MRYVLEGSVRRAGNRLRINGQLIENEAGSHISADRWDGELEDIFESQDQMTARIYNAIGGELVKEEAGRIPRSGRAKIMAWSFVCRRGTGFIVGTAKAACLGSSLASCNGSRSGGAPIATW